MYILPNERLVLTYKVKMLFENILESLIQVETSIWTHCEVIVKDRRKTIAGHTILAVCPRSLDLFYIETYYIKWVKTSWTYSRSKPCIIEQPL